MFLLKEKVHIYYKRSGMISWLNLEATPYIKRFKLTKYIYNIIKACFG